MKNLIKNYGFWIAVTVMVIGIFYGIKNLSECEVVQTVNDQKYDQGVDGDNRLFRQSPLEIKENNGDPHDSHGSTPWGPISQLGQSGVSYIEMEPMFFTARLKKIEQLRNSARCAPRSNISDVSSDTFN